MCWCCRSGHPLCTKAHLTLEDIAHEPLITYHPSYTGRTKIDHAFATRKLEPRIALEAIDSDVIKTYVKLGSRAWALPPKCRCVTWWKAAPTTNW